MAKRGAAVLEMPEPEFAPEAGARRGPRVRRDPLEDFAGGYGGHGEEERPRLVRTRPATASGGLRLKLGRRVPTSVVGLVAAGSALLMVLGCAVWLLIVARSFLLTDARFNLARPSAIEVEGNKQVTRGQVLGVFADDLERNIFRLSLDGRRAELEAMPWVERATVMRLLPGRVRVSVVERVPVAFARDGGHIGLVDAGGVLLDMPKSGAQYSFPVVTGISATDPLSVRAARMRLYSQFMGELEGGATESLSEVDLANPEDVRAVVEEHGVNVLVHFGSGDFAARFRKVKELLPQWHAQYPNLASADMRYEHEIPLSMAAPVMARVELPVKPAAVVAAGQVTKKLVPRVVAPAIVPAGKVSAGHAVGALPTGPRPVAGQFMPPVVAKPWQPVPTLSPVKSVAAGTTASVSSAARASFVAKPVAGVGQKQAPTSGKPPVLAPKAVVAAARPVPAPLPHTTKGKPSAGHPALVPSDPNFPVFRDQGLRP